MKYFEDGNQLVITKDDFVSLQESPAVFYPLESKIAKTIKMGVLERCQLVTYFISKTN